MPLSVRRPAAAASMTEDVSVGEGPLMRVQRSACLTGVGAGPRSVEVKVSYSPREFQVVAAEAARQGWGLGAWVGAILEHVERLADPPEGGGLEAVAWGRIAERAGSVEAAARCLAGGNDPRAGAAVESSAQKVRRLCSAQSIMVRQERTRANARAAEFAELLVLQLDESFRGAGGTDRRRVRVLLSAATVTVLRRGVPAHTGMAVSEWVGSVAAAAAGWLTSTPDSLVGLDQWLSRVSAVQTMLHTTAEQRCGHEAVAGWACAELAAAERSLGQVARDSRSQGGPPTGVVLDRLGWRAGQLRLGLSYPTATMVAP